MNTVMTYIIGFFAIGFLCTTLHYQNIVIEQNIEINRLKSKQLKSSTHKVVIKTPTLAQKNRNPLNVKSLKNQLWEGQIGTDKFGHAQFKNWEYGIRAASFVLKNYAKKHKIETVRGIVERFATGNREEYISFLCNKLKVKHDEKINVIQYIPKLLREMSNFESGERLPEHLFVAYDVISTI